MENRRVDESTGNGLAPDTETMANMSRNYALTDFAPVAALFIAACGALVVGWLIGHDYALIAAGLVAAFAFSFILFRTELLLWSSIWLGIVIAGLAKLYAPALQQIRWAIIPLTLALAMHAIWAVISDARTGVRRQYSPLVTWALVFILYLSLISIIDKTDLNRFVVGFKGYFQVWGLFFALALIPWPKRVIDRIPIVFLGIALIQLPFVLHQYLFIAPSRVGVGDGVVAVDVIAGTFGADAEGGGANAVLAAFQIVVFWGLVAARRNNLISTRFLVLASIPILFPIFVNMAKVSFFYLIAGFGILFGWGILRRPRELIMASAGVFAMLALLLTAMTMNAPEDAKVQNWVDLIKYTYAYNVEKEEIADDRLSRFGSLTYWYDNNNKDLTGLLFGHGIGFTRVADTNSVFDNTVAMNENGVSFNMDLTQDIGSIAVSAVLWEGGVFATLILFGLLYAAYRTAGKQAEMQRESPLRASSLKAAQIAVAVLAMSLFHKNAFVFHVGYQAFLAPVLGYIAYWDTCWRSASCQEKPPASIKGLATESGTSNSMNNVRS